MVVWIPNHLNNKLLIVRYSNVSAIQMFAIRIPTIYVFKNFQLVNFNDLNINQKCLAANLKLILTSLNSIWVIWEIHK